MIRQHIIFRGRVQGVGFRYYSVHKARQLGLTGWVENLYDGSVEMEVQGDRARIDELISYLEHQRWILIEEMERTELSVTDENGFYERG